MYNDYAMKRPPWWKAQKQAYLRAKELSDEGVPLLMEMGTGKALPLDTPMLTPSGWTTMRRTKVGQKLIGQDGKPTTVTGVYPQGEQDIYCITFSDGSKASSTLDHLWTVNTPLRKWRGMPAMTMTLGEIMAAGLKHKNGNRKFFIPMVEPVEFEPRPVLLDAYLLGALLGDGYLRKNGVQFSNIDPSIIRQIAAKVAAEGAMLSEPERCTYSINGIEWKKNPVLLKLRKLGLLGKRAETKFIPDDYLFNSLQIRTALLQGLIDTDGSVSGSGSVEFTTVSEKLAEQVKFLVQSLGGTARYTARYPSYTHKGEKRHGQLAYRLYINIPNGIQATLTQAKQVAKRTKYVPSRAIESIEYQGREQVQCIKVDRCDGLFVINDCIVTHNTRVAVQWLEYLFVHHNVKLVYVAAPLAAMHVWIENWHEWSKVPVAFLDLHDTGSAGIREAVRLSSQGFPVICLVNYESAWFIGKKREKIKIDGRTRTRIKRVDTTLSDIVWDAGILDESTAIKHPGSKVSKFFCQVMKPKTRHRAILTGSAYIKRPIDVYAQIKFCVKRQVFEGDFAAFKNEYTIPHPTIPQAILGYKNLDKFVRKLASCAILLKKEDVVDLPPFVHETRKMPLCPRSQKIYDEITEENYAYLEELEDQGVEITASHVFAVQRKQMQITSGFVYPDLVQVGEDEDAKMVKPDPIRLGTEKLGMLLDIMENRDYPTIIVVQMDEEENIIAEALEKKFHFTPKILNGSVKGAAARHELISSAKNDLAFIVKQKVGARGVDMRWADMTIFYSHNHDTEFYDQMMSRNHRGGQTKNITYVHLLCSNTVDMRVMRCLNNDMNLAQQIERDWRQLIK